MTSAILNEEDNLLLDLLLQHPNLLEPSHNSNRDEFMKKASWGQIAIALSISPHQAENKWNDLCHFYKEESALRGCASINNLQALNKSSYDDLYDRLHKIHQSVGKTSASNFDKKKRGKATSNKQKLYSKCTNKCEDAMKKMMDHLEGKSVVTEDESNLNDNIGDLIVAELGSRSPNTMKNKRNQILRLLNNSEKN